jgi:two-component system NtrC family response regulator/two-component system response regulator HydG
MRTQRGRVLVADDERTMLDLFRETLADEWDVSLARDGEEASSLLEREDFDLVFLDLRMPGADGAELLRRIRESGKRVPTVLMSAHAGEGRREELLRGGAVCFLEKPVLPELIEETTRDVLGATNAPAEVHLVARDPLTQDVLEVIDRVAPTRATVLLQGETGTGKELLSREIHRRSGRKNRPFVRVNCASLAQGLLESELFGHERGSFTGAVRTTRGLFQEAHGGTLLLDEISEIPPGLQAKLLRALQEREIRRVGGCAAISVDARVVATTNRVLATEVREGRFRSDLFHRLNVVRIDVPPLRSRSGDLEPLVHAILDRKAEEHELPRSRLTPAGLDRLRRHSWPGNVRELENVLERALLLCKRGVIDAGDLVLEATPTATVGSVPVGATLRNVERTLILETLRSVGGNRTRASRILEISVRTMRNKLREYREAGLISEKE